MKKPTIIASSIGKGGQNKTTLVWAISTILARDHPVLVIDMDPQQSLSAAIADFKSVTIYDVIGRGLPIESAIAKAAPQYGENLEIIPASGLLTGLDAETAGNFTRHLLLVDVLESIKDYHYILIDCPSSQGLLTIAPLCCADFVISPVSCEPESYHQVERFKGTVELIRRRKLNERLVWLPLVATMLDRRNKLDIEVEAALRWLYPTFKTVIPRTVRLREAMAAKQTCTHPSYITLIQEILERIDHDKKTIQPSIEGKGGNSLP